MRRANGTGSSGADIPVRTGNEVAVDEVFHRLRAGLKAEASRHTRTLGDTVSLDLRALVRDVLRENGAAEGSDFGERCRLLLSASCAIRHLLADFARDCRAFAPRRKRATASRSLEHLPSLGQISFDRNTVEAVLELDAALERLAVEHPRWADVVQCVFFGRMSFAETAAALDVAPGTVRWDWVMSRLWIHRWIMGKDPDAATNRERT